MICELIIPSYIYIYIWYDQTAIRLIKKNREEWKRRERRERLKIIFLYNYRYLYIYDELLYTNEMNLLYGDFIESYILFGTYNS